ncbi:apolipoprotein D [Aplysia californica]|uniref:Apolipoprotein D n=1 Tax=Aplysia californica TaxID=6500 RepID=A0ABM1AA29_APLCA|nr:apolipoprotein D [Aplysia californica]
MCSLVLYLVVLVVLVIECSAFLVFSPGVCPSVPSMLTFDLKNFLGRWYIYETFDVPFQYGISLSLLEGRQPNYRVVSTDYTSYAVIYSCTRPTVLPFRMGEN